MALRLLRYFIFFLGLILFGLGNAIAVNVQSLGLHPWEVLKCRPVREVRFHNWNVECHVWFSTCVDRLCRG